MSDLSKPHLSYPLGIRLRILAFILLLSAAVSGCEQATEPSSATPDEALLVALNTPPFPSAFPLFPKQQLLGQFLPAEDIRFDRIPDTYSRGSARGKYLHRTALEAFINMHEAAKSAGVDLYIISATRNFSAQQRIWEAKWNGSRLVGGRNLAKSSLSPADKAKEILKYSSMPGTSRHHWGTDVDINALTNTYFEKGEGKKVYDWLSTHAPAYGFGQPYTTKDSLRLVGYEEEKWHWSYLPLAKPYLVQYQTQITTDDIRGFLGSEVAGELAVIETYVLGIHPACK